MALINEMLKAATKKELRMLVTAWTTRVTEGRWIIQLGSSTESVTRIEDAYEIYMKAAR